MGRSLDSTLKMKLEESRKEVSSLASEFAHYKGEVGRLQQRVQELQGDKERLYGYFTAQLSDSLIPKYDSLTKEN
jgi:predicted nuclease with TOPRIM domain